MQVSPVQKPEKLCFLQVATPACAAAEALKELEYPVKLQKLLLTPQREVLVELVITKDRCTAPVQL